MADPWIGPAYGQQDNLVHGAKILVLGESQYKEGAVGKVVPTLTQEAVNWYLAGHHLRFFANVAAAVSGRSKAGKEHYHAIWQGLAFHNYIPVIVAHGPREFDEQYWAHGTEEFNAVLEQHRPELVLVCGYRLFPRILRRHTPGFEGDPWKHDQELVQLSGPSKPLALRMMHPSAAYSAKVWTPKIAAALERVRAR